MGVSLVSINLIGIASVLFLSSYNQTLALHALLLVTGLILVAKRNTFVGGEI